MSSPTALDAPELAAYQEMVTGFRLDLEVRNRAATTIRGYMDVVGRFGVFLHEQGMPTEIAAIERSHVEAFIRDSLQHFAPSTVALYYRVLQQFFGWALAEEEITASPMTRMKMPKVPDDRPPAVLSDEDLRALLKACEGSDFRARRDRALILVLIDTGVRLGEITGMQVADVDLKTRTIKVTGKGSKMRLVPLGARSAQAVSRYLRARSSHAIATSPALWLSRDMPITVHGVSDMLERRANEAGIGHIHAHQFRHGFAHNWRLHGGDDDSLMSLAGWTSRAMLNRYGRSVAAERAREVHRRLSPGDRL